MMRTRPNGDCGRRSPHRDGRGPGRRASGAHVADGLVIERGAPCLGEHNEEVFGGLLGLSPDEWPISPSEGRVSGAPCTEAVTSRRARYRAGPAPESPRAAGRPPGGRAGQRACACAGKLLADMGADVILVEPPGGHATRAIGPFVDDQPGPERSLWWWHHHTSKRGVVLDLDNPGGGRAAASARAAVRHRARRRATGAAWPRAASTGTRSWPPRAALIWVSVSPFGQRGPAGRRPGDRPHPHGRGRAGVELRLRRPRPAAGPRAGGSGANLAGVHAVMAALVAVVHRDASGVGQHIDVNMHAASNVTTELGSYEWLVARHTVQRQTGRHASVTPTGPTQLKAADGGYVTLGFLPRSARDYRAILDWLGSSTWPRSSRTTSCSKWRWNGAVSRSSNWVRTRSRRRSGMQGAPPWPSSPPMWTRGRASTDSSSAASSAGSSMPPKR